MSENTASDCLRAAYQAILRGDYAERDRLCDRAEQFADDEHIASATQRVLAVDYYVARSGTAILTKAMAKAAGALQ